MLFRIRAIFLTLDQHIGFESLGGSQTFSITSKSSRSNPFYRTLVAVPTIHPMRQLYRAHEPGSIVERFHPVVDQLMPPGANDED